MWLYSPVCVGPGRKPRRPVFSERGLYVNGTKHDNADHMERTVNKTRFIVSVHLGSVTMLVDKQRAYDKIMIYHRL